MRDLEFIEGPMFVANDGGRWFVMQNIDHCDSAGNWGMSTEYCCDPHGYDTEAQAEAAMIAAEG